MRSVTAVTCLVIPDFAHLRSWTCDAQVEALLDCCHGEVSVEAIVGTLEHLGYRSWAHRVLLSAGVTVCWDM